jgi:hypothetical protein
MKIIRTIWILAVLVIFSLLLPACDHSISQEDSQKIAEEFVKSEATYRFDGMAASFRISGNAVIEEGWKFTIEFESRHAGYGDRGGQILAEVITHHTAEITVQKGKVIAAVMDEQWNMLKQQMSIVIKPAPIDEVKVNILKSNPAQISVYIKGGLPDGGTTFNNLVVTRNGSDVEIKVTVRRPAEGDFPAIYTYFEKYVNLGSDFYFGTTYSLKVNDYTTTFEGTLINHEGFAIYPTRDDIDPQKMESLSYVSLAAQPIISLQDIITYDAQTHEIKLTDEAFQRVSNLEVPARGTSLMVCVDNKPVYWGAYWSIFSSQSFNGVVIQKSLATEAKAIIIKLGYPAPSFFKGEDPRNNTEVINSLERSEKLINLK